MTELRRKTPRLRAARRIAERVKEVRQARVSFSGAHGKARVVIGKLGERLRALPQHAFVDGLVFRVSQGLGELVTRIGVVGMLL